MCGCVHARARGLVCKHTLAMPQMEVCCYNLSWEQLSPSSESPHHKLKCDVTIVYPGGPNELIGLYLQSAVSPQSVEKAPRGYIDGASFPHPSPDHILYSSMRPQNQVTLGQNNIQMFRRGLYSSEGSVTFPSLPFRRNY